MGCGASVVDVAQHDGETDVRRQNSSTGRNNNCQQPRRPISGSGGSSRYMNRHTGARFRDYRDDAATEDDCDDGRDCAARYQAHGMRLAGEIPPASAMPWRGGNAGQKAVLAVPSQRQDQQQQQSQEEWAAASSSPSSSSWAFNLAPFFLSPSQKRTKQAVGDAAKKQGKKQSSSKVREKSKSVPPSSTKRPDAVAQTPKTTRITSPAQEHNDPRLVALRQMLIANQSNTSQRIEDENSDSCCGAHAFICADTGSLLGVVCAAAGRQGASSPLSRQEKASIASHRRITTTARQGQQAAVSPRLQRPFRQLPLPVQTAILNRLLFSSPSSSSSLAVGIKLLAPASAWRTGSTASWFAAVETGDEDAVLAHLQCDPVAVVHSRDYLGRTALHAAMTAASSSVVIIRLLMQHGADPAARDCHGRTCVHLAARHPLLLEHELSCLLSEARSSSSSSSSSSSLSSSSSSLSMLVDSRDHEGLTPLMMCLMPLADAEDDYCGDYSSCKRRKKKNAATIECHLRVVRLLIENGASIYSVFPRAAAPPRTRRRGDSSFVTSCRQILQDIVFGCSSWFLADRGNNNNNNNNFKNTLAFLINHLLTPQQASVFSQTCQLLLSTTSCTSRNATTITMPLLLLTNQQEDFLGWSLCHELAYRNNSEQLEDVLVAIRRGIVPEAAVGGATAVKTTATGEPPIFVAIRRGSSKCLELFLQFIMVREEEEEEAQRAASLDDDHGNNNNNNINNNNNNHHNSTILAKLRDRSGRNVFHYAMWTRRSAIAIFSPSSLSGGGGGGDDADDDRGEQYGAFSSSSSSSSPAAVAASAAMLLLRLLRSDRHLLFQPDASGVTPIELAMSRSLNLPDSTLQKLIIAGGGMTAASTISVPPSSSSQQHNHLALRIIHLSITQNRPQLQQWLLAVIAETPALVNSCCPSSSMIVRWISSCAHLVTSTRAFNDTVLTWAQHMMMPPPPPAQQQQQHPAVIEECFIRAVIERTKLFGGDVACNFATRSLTMSSSLAPLLRRWCLGPLVGSSVGSSSSSSSSCTDQAFRERPIWAVWWQRCPPDCPAETVPERRRRNPKIAHQFLRFAFSSASIGLSTQERMSICLSVCWSFLCCEPKKFSSDVPLVDFALSVFTREAQVLRQSVILQQSRSQQQQQQQQKQHQHLGNDDDYGENQYDGDIQNSNSNNILPSSSATSDQQQQSHSRDETPVTIIKYVLQRLPVLLPFAERDACRWLPLPQSSSCERRITTLMESLTQCMNPLSFCNTSTSSNSETNNKNNNTADDYDDTTSDNNNDNNGDGHHHHYRTSSSSCSLAQRLFEVSWRASPSICAMLPHVARFYPRVFAKHLVARGHVPWGSAAAAVPCSIRAAVLCAVEPATLGLVHLLGSEHIHPHHHGGGAGGGGGVWDWQVLIDATAHGWVPAAGEHLFPIPEAVGAAIKWMRMMMTTNTTTNSATSTNNISQRPLFDLTDVAVRILADKQRNKGSQQGQQYSASCAEVVTVLNRVGVFTRRAVFGGPLSSSPKGKKHMHQHQQQNQTHHPLQSFVSSLLEYFALDTAMAARVPDLLLALTLAAADLIPNFAHHHPSWLRHGELARDEDEEILWTALQRFVVVGNLSELRQWRIPVSEGIKRRLLFAAILASRSSSISTMLDASDDVVVDDSASASGGVVGDLRLVRFLMMMTKQVEESQILLSWCGGGSKNQLSPHPPHYLKCRALVESFAMLGRNCCCCEDGNDNTTTTRMFQLLRDAAMRPNAATHEMMGDTDDDDDNNEVVSTSSNFRQDKLRLADEAKCVVRWLVALASYMAQRSSAHAVLQLAGPSLSPWRLSRTMMMVRSKQLFEEAKDILAVVSSSLHHSFFGDISNVLLGTATATKASSSFLMSSPLSIGKPYWYHPDVLEAVLELWSVCGGLSSAGQQRSRRNAELSLDKKRRESSAVEAQQVAPTNILPPRHGPHPAAKSSPHRSSSNNNNNNIEELNELLCFYADRSNSTASATASLSDDPLLVASIRAAVVLISHGASLFFSPSQKTDVQVEEESFSLSSSSPMLLCAAERIILRGTVSRMWWSAVVAEDVRARSGSSAALHSVRIESARRAYVTAMTFSSNTINTINSSRNVSGTCRAELGRELRRVFGDKYDASLLGEELEPAVPSCSDMVLPLMERSSRVVALCNNNDGDDDGDEHHQQQQKRLPLVPRPPPGSGGGAKNNSNSKPRKPLNEVRMNQRNVL